MAKKILTDIEVTSTINAAGNISTSGWLYSNASGADEGGQIVLAKPTTNTGLSSPVVIDIYQNKLRFFEYGGTNRGYYVDITSGGASAGTSLTGGSTGAMNYAQTEGTKQSAISAAGTTIVSVSITTNGYPILVQVTGDVENNSAGGWTVLQLYRGTTAIGNPIHTEGSAASENTPYALSVIDAPVAGTYTYALKLNNSAGGTFNFGESDGPVITAVELSGPKGDTGSAGASYTLPAATSSTLGGIELFSDTVQSTAANSVTSTASRTYGLQVNASGQAVVNVPWTDTLSGATTVGTNIATLTNPSTTSWLRINADNTVTARSAPNTRTDLGGTTVGQSFFTLTNPSAITFPRINADNTVTALSASAFKTAIGGDTILHTPVADNVVATTTVANGTMTGSAFSKIATLSQSTTYLLDCVLIVKTIIGSGTGTGNFTLTWGTGGGGGPSGNLETIYTGALAAATTSTTTNNNVMISGFSSLTLNSSVSGTQYQRIIIKGIVRTGSVSAYNIYPILTAVNSSTPGVPSSITTLVGSYIQYTPLTASGSDVSIGTWV